MFQDNFLKSNLKKCLAPYGGAGAGAIGCVYDSYEMLLEARLRGVGGQDADTSQFTKGVAIGRGIFKY